jgi:hypothetical protein
MRYPWRYDFIPILSLAGVMLDALGGLYLAYDLLGGNRGPLRTVTKSTSYGVLFGAIYVLPLGVWFGLAGLLFSGPALSFEIERRRVRHIHPFREALAFGMLRAFSFGAAGWLSKDHWFGIYFGILCLIGFVAGNLIVGPPAVAKSGHAQINKPGVKRAVFRAASIGLAGVVSGLIHGEPHALSYGVEVGLVTGMSSGILLAVAPAVEVWVDNLPARWFGGFGAILLLIGSLFQTIQYVFPLLGLPMM